MAAESGTSESERRSWCGAAVGRGDGFRAAEHPGERMAVFCRLEHVVPWALQGAHWDGGTPDGPAAAAGRGPAGVAARGDGGGWRGCALRRADRGRLRPARAPPRRAPGARRVLLRV